MSSDDNYTNVILEEMRDQIRAIHEIAVANQSKIDKIDRPDRIILDLDPSPNVSWADIIEAAHIVKQHLEEFGLIEVIIHDDQKYLHQEQLKEVEKMMRMHYELDINMEGIDVISHLLKRMNSLQKELIETQNKLRLYEH